MAFSPAESLALFTGLPALFVGVSGLVGLIINGVRDRRKQGDDEANHDEAQVRADLAAERLENTRLLTQIGSLRAESDRYRNEALTLSAEKIAMQNARHDLRSVFRQACVRMQEAGIDYKDLSARAEEILSR